MLYENGKNVNVPSSAKENSRGEIYPALLKESLGEDILFSDEYCSFLKEIWAYKVTGGREGLHF